MRNLYSQQKETIVNLNKHIEEQDTTIKQLRQDCSNHDAHIKQLNDTVADQKSQIESLYRQLRERERWLQSSPKFSNSTASSDCTSVLSYVPQSENGSKSSTLNDDDSYGPLPSLIHDDSWCYPDSEKDLSLSPPNKVFISCIYILYLNYLLNAA